MTSWCIVVIKWDVECESSLVASVCFACCFVGLCRWMLSTDEDFHDDTLEVGESYIELL